MALYFVIDFRNYDCKQIANEKTKHDSEENRLDLAGKLLTFWTCRWTSWWISSQFCKHRFEEFVNIAV